MDKIQRDIYFLRDWIKYPIDYPQGSNKIPLEFTARDYDLPQDASVRICFKKPSGKMIYNELTGAINGNVITIQPEKQMTAEAGKTNLQIEINKDSQTLMSFVYPVNIKRSLMKIDSQNGSNFVDEYLTKLQECLNQMESDREEGIRIINEANSIVDAFRSAVDGTLFADDKISDITGYTSKKIEEELAKKNKIYVNACDYGFSTENDGLENSRMLQSIVDTLNAAGGGVIYVPAGTYDMDNTGYGGGNNQTGYCVIWKSNVSLKGDGTATKFNKVCHTTYGNTLFFYDDLFSNGAEKKYIENVVMEDFSITAQNETWDYASSSGKGIFFVPPKNCHIKRVKVYGTPATALAFDCPVECSIEECHVENAGRSGYTAGCAGIGNGTGLAEKESCIVSRNVIIGGTGTRFGIFHENQAAFNLGGTNKANGYGQIITGNIIIGCRNGIGGCIANGEDITNNYIIDSTWNGIYIGSHAKDITIKGNVISKPANYGILIEGSQWDSEPTPIEMKNITIEGNTIIDPANRHIIVSGNKNIISGELLDLCIQGNKLYGGTGIANIAISAKDSNGLKMRNVCLKDNIGYGLNPDEINIWNAEIENTFIFANVIKNITISGCTLIGEKTLEATGNITEDGQLVLQKTKGAWSGKTFTAFGSSITYQCQNYGGGYLEKIKELCGFKDYGNAGMNGAPMVNDTENGNGINYTIKNTDMSARDLILIECCTNDFKLNAPVGLLGTTNIDTFSGALKDALDHIFTTYPAKQVVIIADPQRDNDGYDVEYRNAAGCRLIDYIDMAILIGNKYGIPVCDLYRNSGINTMNIDTYTVDGLHPNAAGYDLIGKCAAGVINSMAAGNALPIPNVDEDILLGDDYYDISESVESKYKIVMAISGTYYLYSSHMPLWVYKDGENYHEVLDITMTERLSAENKIFGNGTSLNSEGTTALDSIFRYMNGARTIDQFICANHDIYIWGTNTKILRKSFD